MYQLRRFFSIGLMLAFVSIPASGVSLAQDLTPSAVASQDYPVAVHEGTCANPTLQPAFEVTNTVPYGADNDDADYLGNTVDQSVLEASATISATLEDVANGQHVIAVHASSEEYETILACGEIAGVNDDGQMVFAIDPVDGSGVSGIAILNSGSSGLFDLGDDEIQVTVYVVAESDAMGATPAA